jgi:hypothetical protein
MLALFHIVIVHESFTDVSGLIVYDSKKGVCDIGE